MNYPPRSENAVIADYRQWHHCGKHAIANIKKAAYVLYCENGMPLYTLPQKEFTEYESGEAYKRFIANGGQIRKIQRD
jgi:hypothetical protein